MKILLLYYLKTKLPHFPFQEYLVYQLFCKLNEPIIDFLGNDVKTYLIGTKDSVNFAKIYQDNPDELFEEIDLEGLVENKGILYIWNNKDLKSKILNKIESNLSFKLNES